MTDRSLSPSRSADLFWAKVNKNGPGGCWLYTGFIKWDGYGWLARHMNGRIRHMTAHRYSWILTNGEPAKGVHIMHTCDVPACCNPEHLRLGTHIDNMADAKAKRRHSHGERLWSAKLNYALVQRVKADRATGMSYRALSQRYGVAMSTLSNAVNGKTWKAGSAAPAVHMHRTARPRRAA